MRKLITILIIAITTVSCGKIKEARHALNDIEAFINERPDSALAILDSFDTLLLNHKSIWAHHSLLHAQAKDKCYIDETNDSLMTQVVNYYEGKRDKEKRFKAYYYLGRIQYNAGDYAASMLSYTKAEQIIDNIDDDFIKGLLHAQLGILHHKYFDYQRSLESYDKAQMYYEACDMQSHVYFIKLDIGLNYQEQRKYSTAEFLYQEVMQWAFENGQYSLCEEALGLLISLYGETNQLSKSNKLINSEYANINPDNIYVLRGKLLESANNNSFDDSIKYQKEIWESANTISDSINNYYNVYTTARIRGNYEIALYAHEKIQSIQDSILIKSMKYPLLSIKNKYLQTENDNMQLCMRRDRNKIVIIIVIFCLISIIASLAIHHKITLQNMKIARYVEVAEELEITLQSKCKELRTVNIKHGAIRAELAENCEFIANMLSRQYELLNKLTSTYYETHGCNKDKEAIYKYVSKEIECLSSDKKTIQHLEELVNLHKGNIMKTIRENLPNLTEMEYRLLCYLCVGFSAKAISIFTGDSTNNIYVKKSRIKNEIMKLDVNIRKTILQAMNSQEMTQ